MNPILLSPNLQGPDSNSGGVGPTYKADRERLYTYADVPLTYPEPEVLAFVRDRIRTGTLLTAPRPRAAQEIYWPGEWMADLPVQVGRLRWPQGASRFAYGFWLASDEQLNAIQRKVRISPFGYDSQPLTMGDGTNTLTTEMYMLPPRPLTGFPGASSSNRLWLLPLVDDRYWWWWRTTRIDVTAGTTGWESLLASLEAGLGVQLHHDGVSSEYLKPHPAFTTRYEYLPPLLDAAARSIGKRVVRKLNGEVWLESPDRAHAIEARNRQMYPDSWCGGDMALQPYLDGDSRMALPEAVHVVHWIVADGRPTNETRDIAVSLGEAKGFRPRLSQARSNHNHRYFHSLASAAHDADHVWTNEEALQLLDRALVCDWYEWQLAYSDRTLTGIVDWEPNGLNAWVEWWHDGTADGVGTSVYCQPPAEYDELYLTFDGDVAIPPVMPVLDTIVVRNLYVLEQGLFFGLGGLVREPKYQVVVGTGPSVTSCSCFKYYYDTTHRLGIGEIPEDPGPLSRVTLEGTGPGEGYAGLSVVQTMTADVARGGLAVVGSRYDHATEPFSAYGTWDDGTERRLDVGGGEWGHPDATSFRLWLAPEYDEEPDQGVLVFRSDATGNFFTAIGNGAVALTVRASSAIDPADVLRIETANGLGVVVVEPSGETLIQSSGLNGETRRRALLHVRNAVHDTPSFISSSAVVEDHWPQLTFISDDRVNSRAGLSFWDATDSEQGRLSLEGVGFLHSVLDQGSGEFRTPLLVHSAGVTVRGWSEGDFQSGGPLLVWGGHAEGGAMIRILPFQTVGTTVVPQETALRVSPGLAVLDDTFVLGANGWLRAGWAGIFNTEDPNCPVESTGPVQIWENLNAINRLDRKGVVTLYYKDGKFVLHAWDGEQDHYKWVNVLDDGDTSWHAGFV